MSSLWIAFNQSHHQTQFYIFFIIYITDKKQKKEWVEVKIKKKNTIDVNDIYYYFTVKERA